MTVRHPSPDLLGDGAIEDRDHEPNPWSDVLDEEGIAEDDDVVARDDEDPVGRVLECLSDLPIRRTPHIPHAEAGIQQ